MSLKLESMTCTYTVSARSKEPDEPIFRFLRTNYGNLPLGQIESIFGFVERSTMYGGRRFKGCQLSTRDVEQMMNAGIGVRIPLTNHLITREEYKSNNPLLKKYHHELNSVITTNDDLATWIREDFPLYDIEASVIKNITSLHKLIPALDIYDTVVLPMASNDDTEFLEEIEDKNRIRLFANGGCAYTCPSRICYRSISEVNKVNGGEVLCSQSLKERDFQGMIDFDLKPLIARGYTRFKLLRSKPEGWTGY